MVKNTLPFLHTFDILEGSSVRHDNKSSNTQCMKIDEEENTWLKEKRRPAELPEYGTVMMKGYSITAPGLQMQTEREWRFMG